MYVCLLEDLLEQGPFAPIFHSTDAEELVDWLGNPSQSEDEEAQSASAAEPDGGDDEPDFDLCTADEPQEPEATSDDAGLLPLPTRPADDEDEPWRRW